MQVGTTSLYKRAASGAGVQCCVRAEFPGPLDADAVNSLEVCASPQRDRVGSGGLAREVETPLNDPPVSPV